jgi:hypothetical protein
VTTPDNSRYAGVHIRGLDEPWSLREGYLVSVVDSRSEGMYGTNQGDHRDADAVQDRASP